MKNKYLILIGLLFFISISVNAYTIDLPNDYILNYEKISNTDNCLIDCSLKFKIKLNKNYLIQQDSFITKKFKNYIGNLDIEKSGFKIKSFEEYQYKDKNKPIYTEIEKQKFCNGIQGINFGIVNSNTGWCKDSLCLLNSTECYYEHEYNTYKITDKGVIFYYNVNEITDYDYSIGNKEVWNKFNPVGKTIKANQWYSIELWGKRLPSTDKKSTFINISLMGKFLKGLSWWNSSYNRKKKIVNYSNVNIPLAINGTGGFHSNIIWITPKQCNGDISIYYVSTNFSDYEIICNDSIIMNYDNENIGKDNNPYDVYSKMIFFYPFSSSGTLNLDAKGVHNTTINGVTYNSNNVYNGGAYFDNNNDKITVLDSDLLTVQNFSMGLWVKFNGAGDDDALFTKWSTTSKELIFQKRNSNNLQLVIYGAGNSVFCNIDTGGIYSPPANKWEFLGIDWDGTQARFLLNGTNITGWSSCSGTMQNTLKDLILGENGDSGDRDLGGYTDIMFMSEVLNNLEWSELYNNSIGLNMHLEGEEIMNNPPTISTPYPSHNSVNISLYPILHVTVEDLENNTMNVTFFNASNNNAICVNNSISNGTILYCKWNTVSLYNTTYNWYVNATDNYTTTKSSVYNFTTYESVTTTTISTEGLINIRVIDLTDSQYEEILIYQNDNTSTKYIMAKNFSKSFKICQNVSYSFIILPKSISIIRNIDNYFLDYLLGNIYLMVFILALISIIGVLIYKRR